MVSGDVRSRWMWLPINANAADARRLLEFQTEPDIGTAIDTRDMQPTPGPECQPLWLACGSWIT